MITRGTDEGGINSTEQRGGRTKGSQEKEIPTDISNILGVGIISYLAVVMVLQEN